MATPSRNGPVRKFATAALVVTVLGCAVVCGVGIYEWAALESTTLGLGYLCGGLLLMLMVVLLYCQLLLIHKFVSYAYRAYDALLEVSDLLRRQEEHARTIAANSNLSEWAKRVVYREKDYAFLRDSIEGAIVRQDWEAAEHLIRDMGTEFGYHDEAARLRGELEVARKATTEERIDAAVARFKSLCDQHKWDQALAESERLKVLFPGQTRIANLPREINRRRTDVKQQLLKDYDQAVRNEDIDRAHRLLFALDQYLVPREAEALKESARGVFRARLEQLKTRFTIAVSYKQFGSAIEAGERLIREFPNSGYAEEISKMLPMMRQRAGQQTAKQSATASSSD